MDWVRARRRVPGRVFAVVVGVTLVMTASLVGVVGLLVGDASGIARRVPYYVLATAIAFVVSLWKLDDDAIDGITVLIATSGIAIGSGILFSLAVEGLRFGFRNPDRIVASHLLVYFVAAALVCTGLGMWSVRHWREFTAYEDPE